MAKVDDLTGQRFGRWLVIKRAGTHTTPNGRKSATWLCRCDCGNEGIVLSQHLKSGRSQSCGCLRDEKRNEARTIHGKYKQRIYWIWIGMKQRCYNSHKKNYHNYGGRGIKVCDEWKYDFQAFYKWALANGYDENAKRGECTIDRIDVDGDYCPENCRWITIQEQQKNRRKRGA